MDAQSTAALGILCKMLSTFMVVPVFLIVVGAPAWVVLRLAKIKAGNRLAPQDEASLQAMSNRMQQMEQRMVLLEHILDTEAPSWRVNPQNGGQYGRQAG
jgi:phage shock protein B